MKISIVMATYNGEKYIYKQLESFYNQTLQADEVLICDDKSTDRTKEIVCDYIKEHNLQDKWIFKTNDPALGCAANFINGAEQATGDIIFFSDQDDIWHPEKLEYMVDGFKMYPDMLACVCLEEYIDNMDNTIKSRFQFTHNVDSGKQLYKKVSLDENIKYNKVPGLCLAVKKNLVNETREMILDNHLMHDLPIGNVAAVKGGLYVLNKKLVYYRQHSSNLSTPKITIKSRLTNLDFQIAGRKQRLELMKALDKYYGKEIKGKERKRFNECVKYTSDSIEYLENKELMPLFKQLFINNKMVNPWISVNNFACVLYAKRNARKGEDE